MQISEAQKIVKTWSDGNGWQDVPNINKFDHLHEELVEMSQHLRYKSEAERIEYVKNNKDYFISEMGDLLFGVCRLANQLDVNLEDDFSTTKEKAEKKYQSGIKESNIPWKNN
jgi:NTP pyrophosphatase (non-canonical NTP hydrolase)